MASDELQVLKQLLDGMQLGDGPLEQRRALMESFSQPPPEGVAVTSIVVDGVPAEWVVAAGVDVDRVILYVHGGGYYMGSLGTHRVLCSRLSAAASARVLSVDYRLAPEHPYPAAVEDAVAAYRWLLADGIGPDRIAIAGDSAGGGLTLATLLALKQQGIPLPAAAVPISPWTDLELTGASIQTRADVDQMIDAENLKEGAEWYAAGHDLRDPLLSPVHGDFAGLPPMLLHVGDMEMLLDDSVRVAERAKAAGVDVTLEVWDEMPHVWHAFTGLLPEADQAIDVIGAFVRKQIP